MIQISWQDRDDNTWLELEGELDHADCLDIRDEFHERIQKGEGDVIVVMAGLTFMSSMGIGMLVKANETLRKQGRKLKLSGIPDNIRKVLDAMQLLDVFSVV